MKLLVIMVLFLILASFLPLPTETAPRNSLQVSSAIPKQEIIGEVIRHGKKKGRNRHGLGRGKKRKKSKNSSAKRFVEKQYLVHNRTLALLGDEVQKILLNTRSFTMNLPYPEGNATKFSVLGVPEKPMNAVGESRIKKVLNSSSVIIGLKLSEARTEVPSSFPSNQEYSYDLDVNSFKDEPHINLTSALARLISAVSNLSSTHLNSATPCDKWLDCKKNLEEIFLGPLPSCPCTYPAEIFYEDKIWDAQLQRYLRWRDASSDDKRLDIYKPGAEYCIRSLIAPGSTSLAAQHCCYDRDRNLITRGSGAGNPNYVSPDISRSLHEKIDILPWKLCKGDFTRFNKIRPPNNGKNCIENPQDDIYEKQVKLVRYYR